MSKAVALGWLASLGWAMAYGPDIAPDALASERADYGEVVPNRSLQNARRISCCSSMGCRWALWN